MTGEDFELSSEQTADARGSSVTTAGHVDRVFRALVGRLPAMIYRCADDSQWTMEFVSRGAKELTGYEPEELIGNARRAYADLIVPWHCEAVCQDIQAAIDKHNAWTISYPIITADGGRKWVWERGNAILSPTGEVQALEGLIVDMTAEHEAEDSRQLVLEEWRRAFSAIADSVLLLDANGFVVQANAASAELTGREIVEIVGSSCHEVVHGLAVPHLDCPRLRALRSGEVETSVIRQGDAWLRLTFHPIKGPGGMVDGGVHIISDVTRDEQAHEELLTRTRRLQMSTEGLVALLAATNEAHEHSRPGHQRRVSELAGVIAQTMGVADDRVEGIRLAALVHDVGMNGVPPEVLAKPGPLSAAEFELVKRHARVGHDILVPVVVPWPIAEVALQHHERLDGSGYPEGRTADAIAFEAKIVAVADAVEAMAAERPHRPASSVEAASAETAAGAGTKYDADVTAACLRAVRDEGFSFSG